jgi:hypothetical protein
MQIYNLLDEKWKEFMTFKNEILVPYVQKICKSNENIIVVLWAWWPFAFTVAWLYDLQNWKFIKVKDFSDTGLGGDCSSLIKIFK